MFANMRDILNFFAYVPNFMPRLILFRYYSVIFAMWWSQRPIWGRSVPEIHIAMTFVNIVAFLYIGLASAGWDLVGLTTWDADPNDVAYGESPRSPLKQPTHPFSTSHRKLSSDFGDLRNSTSDTRPNNGSEEGEYCGAVAHLYCSTPHTRAKHDSEERQSLAVAPPCCSAPHILPNLPSEYGETLAVAE